mmetsp:Transcript_89793/g.134578  ORF Transcript_89793/g.134578 Transcript_89793/m.134578 type:complete len:221 (-) Transcript_89793:58-720(-)
MQKRRAGHTLSSPQQQPPIPATIGGSANSRFARRKSSGIRKFQPVLLLLLLIALGVYVSWSLFPTQVVEIEHGAEVVGQRLAQQAITAEHQVADWLQHKSSSNNVNDNAGSASSRTSEAATARMLAQSSKWVDGEKALKKKLAVLSEQQQENKLLGVPVLTRYLGEDFPAWVTPEMDEADWKKKVEEKYAEMRKEEEEWIKQMQRVIDQRERDVGVTTAR